MLYEQQQSQTCERLGVTARTASISKIQNNALAALPCHCLHGTAVPHTAVWRNLTPMRATAAARRPPLPLTRRP
eukprot:6141054-Pleurochrysis_carterae.AAC.3